MPDKLETSICAEYGIEYPVFGFAHSLMLGAVGVWIGTAWLTTRDHEDQ